MARDIIHNPVKNALIKVGWTITADPLTIQYEEIKVFADLGAERIIEAKRGEEKIAVEVKSFVSRSSIADFENALGQYFLYLGLLRLKNSNTRLYLAVSHVAYNTLFQGKGIQELINYFQIPLIVVDIVTVEVVAWKS